MQFEKINNKGQAQLFENKFLEALTKGSPLLSWGIHLPILIYCFYYGYANYEMKFGNMILISFGALFFWTFFEYLAHRYVFHMISENPKLQRIAYVMHGNHHHYPRDKQRLFMPPVPSLILAALIFGVQYLFLGQYTFAFYPGFILGWLLYASMHYAIHAMAPPFKFMKPLWRNHHLHHYKNEELGFGVSNTFWDKIFGTMFDLNKEKEDKEKVKDLMFEKKK